MVGEATMRVAEDVAALCALFHSGTVDVHSALQLQLPLSAQLPVLSHEALKQDESSAVSKLSEIH